ncbi:MAG: hypothetical protein IJ092_02295 [Atopobiaceae bacterium]|nr:hypothetical protein [Atopobiaceae bacterium]
MKAPQIVSAAAASLLALTLMACTTSSSSYSQYTLDEASGIKFEAENAGSDSEAVTESGIEVKAGDVIVISPFTEKGSFHLTITSDDGKTTVYDDNVEGKVLYTIAADPGTYTVKTTGNNVTGWMTVAAQSQEELIAQDASLAEALEGTGVDPESLKDSSN